MDTGSDNTILPKSIADELGISLTRSSAPPSKTFGGYAVPLLAGDITLQLASNGTFVRWTTNVSFYDFPAPELETVILGHAGFLEFFIATFVGKAGTLTLVANDGLPGV